MEITKSEKIHNFKKSLNISLVKTSIVSFNWLFQIVKSIYCQLKKLSRQSLFALSFVQLLNIYFFLFPFNQCLGVSYLILGGGLIVIASCCQIILYILHFAQFPILIFKFSFAISSFGNFLRNVQLKCLSHTKESVIMAIIFWQTKQNHFELFSRRKVSNILPMQNFHNTFLLIFFISDLYIIIDIFCL